MGNNTLQLLTEAPFGTVITKKTSKEIIMNRDNTDTQISQSLNDQNAFKYAVYLHKRSLSKQN